MVLLEQYITLYEKRWQNVFLGWKYFQILIYFLATIFGVLAGFCWTRINYSFDEDCFLYSNVTFLSHGDNDGTRDTDVNKEISQFGKDTYCSYCQYVSVCSVLFGAIWLTFFTMCGRGGRSDHGYTNMLQKCGICICLLVTVVADWVKIPVLDPHKHETSDPGNQYSDLMGSSNFLKVSTSAPLTRISSSIHSDVDGSVTEVNPLKNKQVLIGPMQNNNLMSDQNEIIANLSTITQKEFMLDANTEIDPNFLISVMNNSQKSDKIGLESINTESKDNPFLEILKNVRHTLLQKTPVTIIGKIKFLQDLQNKLYSYIKPRIKRLWNVEDRQARTEKGMGFPSTDGALMTICFLLFAVFLIKLVKQLIQQLQDKANANALMMTGATPVVPAANGRRKRNILEETHAAAHILHLIESFHVQYRKLATTH